MASRASRIADTKQILAALGMPREQQNERSALCLLAMVDLSANKRWSECSRPLIGITPIMEWVRANYGKDYAPNTRETIRRRSIHQFVQSGIAVMNPDAPERPVNSPYTVYQIETATLNLLQQFRTPNWHKALALYLAGRETLVARYAAAREQSRVPVQIVAGAQVTLTPGAHSRLIGQIIEEFAPRFVPGAALIYLGDTGEKWGYFDAPALAALGVDVEAHGKMPDVVLHDSTRGWLVLVEAVTSHGPVDGKRHVELSELFKRSKAGVVFVTAFPSRAVMGHYLEALAWETEVWVADSPSHMIHFNGIRFVGPYDSE